MYLVYGRFVNDIWRVKIPKEMNLHSYIAEKAEKERNGKTFSSELRSCRGKSKDDTFVSTAQTAQVLHYK